MKIKDRPIAELRPSEYNPRSLTKKQHDELKASMVKLGNLQAAVINMFPGRENVIISGHQRIRIARKIGMKTYPCLEVSFDLVKEREANLRLNKNLGEWDFDMLANEFDLEELTAVGFTEKDLRLDDWTPAGEEPGGGAAETSKAPTTAQILLTFPVIAQAEIEEHLDRIRELDGVEVETLKSPAKKPKKAQAAPLK